MTKKPKTLEETRAKSEQDARDLETQAQFEEERAKRANEAREIAATYTRTLDAIRAENAQLRAQVDALKTALAAIAPAQTKPEFTRYELPPFDGAGKLIQVLRQGENTYYPESFFPVGEIPATENKSGKMADISAYIKNAHGAGKYLVKAFEVLPTHARFAGQTTIEIS